MMWCYLELSALKSTTPNIEIMFWICRICISLKLLLLFYMWKNKHSIKLRDYITDYFYFTVVNGPPLPETTVPNISDDASSSETSTSSNEKATGTNDVGELAQVRLTVTLLNADYWTFMLKSQSTVNEFDNITLRFYFLGTDWSFDGNWSLVDINSCCYSYCFTGNSISPSRSL